MTQAVSQSKQPCARGGGVGRRWPPGPHQPCGCVPAGHSVWWWTIRGTIASARTARGPRASRPAGPPPRGPRHSFTLFHGALATSATSPQTHTPFQPRTQPAPATCPPAVGPPSEPPKRGSHDAGDRRPGGQFTRAWGAAGSGCLGPFVTKVHQPTAAAPLHALLLAQVNLIQATQLKDLQSKPVGIARLRGLQLEVGPARHARLLAAAQLAAPRCVQRLGGRTPSACWSSRASASSPRPRRTRGRTRSGTSG